MFVEQPAVEAARVLAMLGPEAARLQSVEIVASNLEAVFLALTGRRYESEEAEHVLA